MERPKENSSSRRGFARLLAGVASFLSGLTGGAFRAAGSPIPFAFFKKPGVSTNNTLWAWGSNGNGAFGNGNTTSSSAPAQTGALTTWATGALTQIGVTMMKNDGTIWSFGGNTEGNLGLGDTTDRSSPVQVGTSAWTDIAASNGGYHVLAVKNDGTLWTWGRNDWGQLGNGNQTSALTPQAIGALTTWARVGSGFDCSYVVKTDGTLWVFGLNTTGQLGKGNTTSYSSPVQVGALTDWKVCVGGETHAAAIKTDGTLWTWGGATSYGQTGQGDTSNRSSPVKVGALTDWADVSCGKNHCIALKTDGSLWVWGRNDEGQLGMNDTTHRSSPVKLGTNTWSKVGTFGFGSAAVRSDGTLWTWGRNSSGQLGLGDVTVRSSPTQVGSGTNWVDCFGSNSTGIGLRS